MRLFHKLFLLFSLTATVAALVMAIVLAWNLDRGFSAYLDARDAEMLDDFVAELEADLADAGATNGAAPGSKAVAMAVQTMAKEGRIRELPKRPPGGFGEQQFAAPGADRPPGPRGPPPPSFGGRLRISDTQDQLLFGPPGAPEQMLASGLSRNVTHQGQTVAIANLVPRGPAPRSIDTIFLRSQYVGMAGATALLLVLSAALAWVLARVGARTMIAFQRTTHEIAVGNFDARLEVHGKDEFATLARDVNAMAESLQNLQGARRRWLAEISHELRTPLTVLRGELEALESGIRPIGIGAVQSLSEEAKKLNRVIDDLHLLAVSDLGAVSINFTQFDLIELLQKISGRYAPALQDAGLKLDLDFRLLTRLEVRWDVQRIEQLLGNLITNSIRYTDAPGQIRLALSATGHDATLIVEDSAPGVPVDQYALLFEPLHRLEAARDRVSGGSGLGLSVAQAIVKAHRGEIRAGPSRLHGLAIEVIVPINPGSNA